MKQKFDEFKKIIFNGVKEALGEDIILQEVIKRNDRKFYGITKIEEDGLNLIIYLDDYYNYYKHHNCSIKDIIKNIIKDLEAEPNKESLVVISELNNFSEVRNRLAFGLINYEMNKEYLSKVVYTRFLDLAVIYYISIKETEDMAARILVKQELLDMWKVTIEELDSIAKKNSQRLFKASLETLELVLFRNLKIPVEDMQNNMLTEAGLWVLTTKNGHFGAAALLYDGILRNFANTSNCNVFILPSSIEEILLILDNGSIEYTCLQDMVQGINQIAVPVDLILSNNVYKYIRELDKIVMLK